MVYVTETIENVIVYVDEEGVPNMTSTEAKVTSSSSSVVSTTATVAQSTTELLQATSSAAPAPPMVSSFALTRSIVNEAPASAHKHNLNSAVPNAPPAPPAEAQPNTTPPPLPPAPTSEQPPPAPPAPPAPPTPPAPSSAAPDVLVGKKELLDLGVTYDPFGGESQNSRCKSPDEVASDFDRMKNYKAVRIYGAGCDQIPLGVQNAIKHNQKLMAGVYLSNKGGGEDLSKVIEAYGQAIKDYAGGKWDVISLFSVENERVNDHDMTASEVVDAINRAREQLRKAGYNGPVGAVDTVPAVLDNPSICEASDVVMVNCHAFFDTNTSAEQAGTFVKGQVERVRNKCSGKRVVVTESGWPHQGDANGAAVPSPENQRVALESLRENFNHDMFLHHAFDATWKSDWAASFNAERYWGIIQ